MSGAKAPLTVACVQDRPPLFWLVLEKEKGLPMDRQTSFDKLSATKTIPNARFWFLGNLRRFWDFFLGKEEKSEDGVDLFSGSNKDEKSILPHLIQVKFFF